MKKLIALIVVVVVIWGGLKMIGVDTFVSLKSDSSKDDNTPKYAYELVSNVTYEDIMQCRFPKSASNSHGNVQFHDGLWEGTVVADLPAYDLPKITEELNLVLTSNILKIWPKAFDCKEGSFKDKFWNVSSENNNNTYYFEHPAELTRIVLKYENGKIYFKRETKYSMMPGEGGTTLHKKIEK